VPSAAEPHGRARQGAQTPPQGPDHAAPRDAMESPCFTVFTPVFNRRKTLHRVWDSLQTQTCRDFEWVVVDDGSTDGVGELLAEYRRRAPFSMVVLTQTNYGKHVAWNRAVSSARGALFLPADSDDAFVPHTLERFACLWESIPSAERCGYSGVNCLCDDPETGQVVGGPFPADRMVSNNLELAYRYGVTGEKWGVVRTDLLRKLPFPEIPGTCYPMSFLWFSLARTYQVLCVNVVLRHYYRDQANHISASARGLGRAAAQRRHYACWHLNANWDYLGRVRWGRAKTAAAAARASMEIPGGIMQSLRELHGLRRRLTFLAALPVARVYWRR
jgi:glycosyltransferase involved in cell wall biosynthesis